MELPLFVKSGNSICAWFDWTVLNWTVLRSKID